MPALSRAAQGRAACLAIAEDQDLVVARRQLTARKIPRWVLQLELRARRWRRGGRQTVVVHNGPWTLPTRQVIAVFEVGSAAALDGVSALQRAGLKGLTDEHVVVSTARGSTPQRPRGVVVKETRRFREDDVVIMSGIRCMRPAVAAVHAALWAKTDRQATLFLIMTVQQGLASVADLMDVTARIRRDRRRLMIRSLLPELAGGAQSLGELDVARALRRRGLPEPIRQSIRKRHDGKEYLDCEFPDYDLVIEIDGAGHLEALVVLADLLRDLTLAAERKTVIRIPLIAWRLDEEAVLDRLEQLFRSRGWGSQAA